MIRKSPNVIPPKNKAMPPKLDISVGRNKLFVFLSSPLNHGIGVMQQFIYNTFEIQRV